MKTLAALLAAALVLPAAAQTASPATIRDPGRSSAELRRLIGAAAQAGDKAVLTRHAIHLACMGSSLTAESWTQLQPLLDEAQVTAAPACMPGWDMIKPGLERLRGLFHANGIVPAVAPDEAARVPAEYKLVEGIALDKGRLFVGTVVDGRLAYREKGKWHEVPLGSPRNGLFGMKADNKRRLLWIAAGAGDPTAVDGERMSGLIAVNLDTLKVAKRIPLPESATGLPGDVLVAKDGAVYVSNSVSGALHRCKPGCTVLEDLVPAGTFRSPQAMVESPDGKRLYVADYSTGLWTLTLADGKLAPVTSPRPMAMESIDGMLSPAPGTLILIQNGTRPRRILRVTLAPGGSSILATETLASFAATAGESTLGVLDGKDMVYVADSQWERWGKGGTLTDGKPPRETQLQRIRVAP